LGAVEIRQAGRAREASIGVVGFGLDFRNVRRYLTLMKTTVSTKGQLILPAEIRQRDNIEPGQEFEVERIDRGEYRLLRREPPPNEGLVDWLLACPEKGYFVPIESESTDTL
jgi:AbrB family looped-hinge helix DNA binding protein